MNREDWSAKQVSKKEFENLILTNKSSFLDNGYIDFSIASRDFIVILNQHKKIQVFSKSESQLNQVLKVLNSLNVLELKEMVSLEDGFFHWHYRPFDSLSRTAFRTLLKANKLKQDIKEQYWFS